MFSSSLMGGMRSDVFASNILDRNIASCSSRSNNKVIIVQVQIMTNPTHTVKDDFKLHKNIKDNP